MNLISGSAGKTANIELVLYKCKDECRIKEETVVVVQDTERTRPLETWYEAGVMKEIFIVVQPETMNFINIVA